VIDPKKLRYSFDDVIASLESRGFTADRSAIKQLQDEARLSQTLLENLQAKRHSLSEAIALKKRSSQDTQLEQQEVMRLKTEIEQAQQQAQHKAQQWHDFMLSCPNMPSPSVPIGKDESDNQVVSQHGTIKRSQGRDHTEILEAVGLLLSEEAATLSGARFSVLKGAAAKLHRVLTQYMLNYHAQYGYEEFYVPYLVGAEALVGTGQLPKFEADLFQVSGGSKPLYLIPTAEVPLTNLLRDKIINAQDLPLRYMAHTPCFRSEAGSYGKDTKGLFRQHQFEKVELVHFVTEEQAQEELKFLVTHVSNLLLSLELPHQIIQLCTGDMGFSAAQTFDLEVWLPGQQRYREISSCSHFTDFQARRMKARYRANDTAKAPTTMLHTLNGSGVAIGRALIAFIENHGHPDGFDVPKALRPYFDGKNFISWHS
jgi:seryl-tRNA synthetase